MATDAQTRPKRVDEKRLSPFRKRFAATCMTERRFISWGICEDVWGDECPHGGNVPCMEILVEGWKFASARRAQTLKADPDTKDELWFFDAWEDAVAWSMGDDSRGILIPD